MKLCTYAGVSARSGAFRTYVGALLAMGLMGAGAWGQAVVPVDVAGQAPASTPAAAPAPRAPVAAPVAPAPVAAPAAPTPAATPAPAAAAPNPAPAPAAVVEAAPAAASSAPAAAAVVAAPGAATAQDGKAYPVTELKVGYKFPHAGLPEISSLMDSEIALGVVTDGYVAPRAGMPVVTIKLSEIGKTAGTKLYRSAIAAIYTHILRQFSAQNIMGVFVVVSQDDISEKDEDKRGDRTSLSLEVVTSVVKEVRTVAIGDENAADRVNNPRHGSIRQNSPLQPASADVAAGSDVLRKDALDEYVLRLNRFAGRRVDVAISGTNKTGELNLDYLVSENRPWYVFAQVSNTGTSQTADIRERFGYVNNQLTGRDDILTLDYMTADFSKSHAILWSYSLPFMNSDRVRVKTAGSWSEYTASDVGQNNLKFTGTGWTAGLEVDANIYQHRELFVDVVGGVKVQESETQADSGTGYGLFVEPYVGLRLERVTDISTTVGDVTLINYLTARGKDMAKLGREDPTHDPLVLQWDLSQSLFLEPLLDPQGFADGRSTLAHELFGAFRGQYAFENRLVPQAQDVAGGLFSVRGYPESIIAGDSVVLGTLEYRFHLPRILPVQDDPMKTPFLWERSFRYSPQTAYGRPDWDLIFRGFLDAGWVTQSHRQSFEPLDTTLVGTGVGVELQYKQNFNFRIDWGVPLTDVPGEVKAGDSRVHFSATVLY